MEKVAIWVAVAVAIVLSVVAITSKNEVVGGVTWDDEIFQQNVAIRGNLAVTGGISVDDLLDGAAGIAGTKLCINNGSSSYSIIQFIGNTTTPTYSTSTSCN